VKGVRAFFAFWYDFVVGDDWRVALGVVLALGLTFLLNRTTTIPTWWLVPVAVVILLPVSIYRAARRTR
jgi:xanthine/uracil/vitamin C permease (AzgA family)